MKKILPFLLFIITLAADQYLKYLFLGEIMFDPGPLPQMIFNSLVFLFGFIYLFKIKSESKLFICGMWLLLSGFIGTMLNNVPIYYNLNPGNVIVVISGIIVLLSFITENERG